MATRPHQHTYSFDETVPAHDVAKSDLAGASQQRLADASRAAISMARRAAWLAGQISMQEVNLREARIQLDGITDDLVRLRQLFAQELGALIDALLQPVRTLEASDSLSEVAEVTRQIRVSMEQYHNASLL